MRQLTVEQVLDRYEHADVIIDDLANQHSTPLVDPWRIVLKKLILNGAEDHELHLILDTIDSVEFMAGRLKEKPFDAAQFAKDIAD